uniref:Leucine-rich repeat and calponin homology domain-containing protein 2-like n=1 Tax=Paramormyrops kingsleyae TaxID=1676925 RepID=A0A3B3TFJ9_9TELE
LSQLRNLNLESRLKVLLPEDVGTALMDGVVLCHLANHIRPRSVASIHVPSPAVPKLSMAKCRRNVENFLDACKKLGVPQVKKSSARRSGRAVRRVAHVAAPNLPSPYWRPPCRAEPWTGLPWSLGVALHLGPDRRPDHVLEGCYTQLTPLVYVVSENVCL